ncbi:MAG: PASTA domain-containing protein [Prevotella sp.]|nr:PASTA domain-containing protein [Prevotella sp.]
MAIILVVVIAITLFALDLYTKHGESIKVPPVKGMQVEDAAKILEGANLEYEIIDSLYQSEGVPGVILEQIPKEESNVKKGRTILLVIKAKGLQMIPVPELKDFSFRQAEAQLNSLGFKNLVVQEVPSAYAGIVVSVSYKGQELTPNQKVPKGSSLKITVGAGGQTFDDSINTEIPALSEDIEIEESFFE